MTILLVRHGETVDNASHTFQQPNSPLSDNGKRQADQLSLRLAGTNISDIICSDYLRTKQTASYAAKRAGLEPVYSELLRERNFGDLRGRPYAALAFDPFALDYQPVNGEGWEAFDTRVAQAWGLITTLADQAQGDVLVITHGFVCRSIVSNHTRLEGKAELPLRWGNTSLTAIEAVSPWRVRDLNCIRHLDPSLAQGLTSSGQV